MDLQDQLKTFSRSRTTSKKKAEEVPHELYVQTYDL
jgi:hypothetical protein